MDDKKQGEKRMDDKKQGEKRTDDKKQGGVHHTLTHIPGNIVSWKYGLQYTGIRPNTDAHLEEEEK